MSKKIKIVIDKYLPEQSKPTRQMTIRNIPADVYDAYVAYAKKISKERKCKVTLNDLQVAVIVSFFEDQINK